jgi:hypothetical protein
MNHGCILDDELVASKADYNAYILNFISTVRDKLEGILLPFFNSDSDKDLLEKLP